MKSGVLSDSAIRRDCAENYPLALATYHNYLPPSHSVLNALKGVKQPKYQRALSRPRTAATMLNSVGKLSGNEAVFRQAWEQAASQNTPINIFRNAAPAPGNQPRPAAGGAFPPPQAPPPQGGAPPPQAPPTQGGAGIVPNPPPASGGGLAAQARRLRMQQAAQNAATGGGDLDFLGQSARGQQLAGQMLHTVRRFRAADPAGASGSQLEPAVPSGVPAPEMGQQAHPLQRQQPQPQSQLQGWREEQNPRVARGKKVVIGHAIPGMDQPTGKEREHTYQHPVTKEKWYVEPSTVEYIKRHIDPERQDPHVMDKYFSLSEPAGLPRSGAGTRGGKSRDVWYHSAPVARGTLGKLGLANPLPSNIRHMHHYAAQGRKMERGEAEGDTSGLHGGSAAEHEVAAEMGEWDLYVPLGAGGETWNFQNAYALAVQEGFTLNKPNVVYSEFSPLPPQAPPQAQAPRAVAEAASGQAGGSQEVPAE
jgi:hypothetical protein